MLASALIRRVQAAGGTGVVVFRGEATAGTLLIQLMDRGRSGRVLERLMDGDGRYRWMPIGPADAGDAYLAARRRTDPDLWAIELDHPDAAAIIDAMADAG